MGLFTKLSHILWAWALVVISQLKMYGITDEPFFSAPSHQGQDTNGGQAFADWKSYNGQFTASRMIQERESFSHFDCDIYKSWCSSRETMMSMGLL
jgi:hypothetical protein